MYGKFIWLEWAGDRHTINIETWVPGHKPFNTLLDFGSEGENRAMYARYLRMGYKRPE
jgi:hypothetical protein